MIFVDNMGERFTEQEVAALSLSEIKIMGIHRYEENKEKRLFNQMDEMVT